MCRKCISGLVFFGKPIAIVFFIMYNEAMKNFVFDLYNTLVAIHTDEHREESWRTVVGFFAERGIYTDPFTLIKLYDESWAHQIVDLYETSEYTFPEGDITLVYKRMAKVLGGALSDEDAVLCAKIARKASIMYFDLFPGTMDMLNALKANGAKLYILSNAQSAFTPDEIAQSGIADRFDGILLSSDCGCRKPDTAFFDMLFKKYGLKKDETVMIGDDYENDGKGANDYGIKFVFAGGGAAKEHYDEIVGLSVSECLK